MTGVQTCALPILVFARSAAGSGAYYTIQSVEQGVGYRDISLQASGGNLLVGTTTNTHSSKVVVAGVIESTSGGIKFPDNTTQTSAGASTGKAIAMAMIFGF